MEVIYEVDGMEISDAPRYEHRGVMIDVARNFHSTTEILKLIDVLAMYKLNKLHLHLSDDEGWRLQIPGLEELTEVNILVRISRAPVFPRQILPNSTEQFVKLCGTIIPKYPTFRSQ